jgi:hypothetical protein
LPIIQLTYLGEGLERKLFIYDFRAMVALGEGCCKIFWL